jgi:hypothetical protein
MHHSSSSMEVGAAVTTTCEVILLLRLLYRQLPTLTQLYLPSELASFLKDGPNSIFPY